MKPDGFLIKKAAFRMFSRVISGVVDSWHKIRHCTVANV